MKKIFLFLMILALVVSVLCGCDLIKDAFVKGDSDSTSAAMKTDEQGLLYQLTDDGKGYIVANGPPTLQGKFTSFSGYTLSFDGDQWSYTHENVMLVGNYEINFTDGWKIVLKYDKTIVNGETSNLDAPQYVGSVQGVNLYYCERCIVVDEEKYFLEGVSTDDIAAGSVVDIVIPDTYDGKPVVGIANGAFFMRYELQGVTIPSSVKTIGNYAFYGCTNLKSIIVPEGVTSVGSWAFNSCESLASVELPSSVTSISSGALANCSELSSIRFNGTKAEWSLVSKADFTDVLVTVYCIDGELIDGGTENPDDGGSKPEDDLEWGDGGEGSEDSKFSVTFKYVTPEGVELRDSEGFYEKVHSRIDYGGDARNQHLGSVTAFEKYVIIGWNTDLTEAMAGEVDEDCIKNIKKDKIVYSVVREKELKTVNFLDSKGNLFNTVQLYEGSALDSTVLCPLEMGRYFKEWQFVSTDDDNPRKSTVDCIYGDCTFKAVMGVTDGTIGKVAKGSVALDAKKDSAYETSGAYLAHNSVKTVNDVLTVDEGGSYAVPTAKADTWMVWDGEDIYLYMEIYDKSLTCRSDAYVRSGVDAWCNDAVEIWYSFEQNATLENRTRVGLNAFGDIMHKGDGKYALPRSVYNGSLTGIGGGRSTHYDDIEYAVRNSLLETDNDLSRDGVNKPSYIIEWKLPAYTEGEADTAWAYKDWDGAKEEKLTGFELEEFMRTGRLYGVDEAVDKIDAYRFTEGEKLMPGNVVRFSLQINDLQITVNELFLNYLDAPSPSEAIDFVEARGGVWDWNQFDSKIMLYEFDEVTKKLKSASVVGKFTASGSTQMKLDMYLTFSLGDDERADTKVWGFAKDKTDRKKQVMLDKDGNEYICTEIAN